MRGDGILEVIDDLVADDLAQSPPARLRRRLVIGKDERGEKVSLATHGHSILVTGREKTGKSALVRGMLERLCAQGYQFCVIDGRGEYLDFEPALVFGTPEHAPDPLEVFTALEKPDVHAVVGLAAVAARDRAAFYDSFAVGLEAARVKSGRPHWLVIDDAQELLPRERAQGSHVAPNTIYVTSDPDDVAADILADVDAVITCGSAGGNEALVRFQRSERAPVRVRFDPGITQKREIHPGVGPLLRRAS
jgi:hypothetical protein